MTSHTDLRVSISTFKTAHTIRRVIDARNLWR